MTQPTYMWSLPSSFWRHLDQRDQLLIVTLHRLDHSYGVPVSTVEKNLRSLADRYRFVLPEELQHTAIKGKMAMLTVDDGHRDIYLSLYPIIKSLKISMVICLTTDFFLQNQWLWFDKMHWIFKQTKTNQHIQSFSFIDDIQVNQASLNKYLKPLSSMQRTELIEKLAQHCKLVIPPEPTEDFHPVQFTDVNDMLKSGVVELASHSVTHPLLSKVSDTALEYEVQFSKKALEDFSGRTIHAFCYPNGLTGDYDERTKLAVKIAGYSMAFSSQEGINYKKNIQWNELKRIHVHKDPFIFKRNTSGLFDIMNKVRQFCKS